MVRLLGTLILISHYRVQGSAPRQLQEVDPSKIVNDLNAKLDEATAKARQEAQGLANGNESSLADNSIPITSATSPVVPILYYLQRNPDVPMEKLFQPTGVQGIGPQWVHAIVGILFPVPLLLFGCGLFTTCLACMEAQRYTAELPKDEKGKFVEPILGGVGQKACYSICFIMMLIILASGSFFNTVTALNGVVGEVAQEADYINDTMGMLQPKIHNADLWLSGWLDSCPGWTELEANPPAFLADTVSLVAAKNQEYVDLIQNQTMMVYNLTKEIMAVPPRLHEAHQLLRDFAKYQVIAGSALMAPSVILLMTLFWCLSSAMKEGRSMQWMTETHGNGWIYGLLCCNVVVVLVATVVCIVALVTGLFCWEAEVNTVHLASAFQNGNGTSLAANLTSYYLTGDPPKNTIVESLREVRDVMQTVGSSLSLLKTGLEVVGLVCPNIGFIAPGDILDQMVPRINQILPLTKRDRVYYFFDEIANRAICKNGAEALSLTLVSHAIISLFLLPYVIIKIHQYVLNQKVWLEYKAKEDSMASERLLATQKAEKELRTRQFEEELGKHAPACSMM
jgi:hypothetical protein